MMKNKNATIESLENDYWVSPSIFPTELVKKVFLLRKKNLSDLDSNDLRILISQNVGLKYVVSIAIKKLEENILEEAFYYPGDLLAALLNIDTNYWKENGIEKNNLISLLQKSKPSLSEEFDDDDEVDQEILKTIDKFLFSNT
jgi:hypothetical protein